MNLCGTVRDITDEIETEARKQDTEDRLSLAVEASGIGLWTWDLTSGAVTWSAQCYVIHGLGESEFDGTDRAFFECVHPLDRSRVQETVHAAIEAKELYICEFRIVRPDGAVVWVSNRGRARYDSDGQAVTLLGTLCDVTRLKQTQLELDKAQQRIRVALEVASDVVWTKDPAGRMVGEQRLWAAFTGQSHDAYQNFGWLKALHPEDVEPVCTLWQECVVNGDLYVIECRVRRHDGVYRTFEVRAAPVRNAEGEVQEWVGVHTDITEMREAHRIIERQNCELRQADVSKDIFLATLSHELRNPLAPISTAAELITNPALPSERVEWARGVIKRQVAHVSRLLDDLLDISRITQGKIVLRTKVIGLDEVVCSAIEIVQPLVERRHHHLSVVLPSPAPLVKGDPARLAQVLGNLLVNACKYTDEAGQIGIEVAVKGVWVDITVRDNGIGLDPEAIPTLFQMFRQVPGTRERSEGGLGVGLALVRGLIEQHGGHVEARSDGLGRGSVFTVHLPVHDPSIVADVSADPVESQSPRQRRVLIIDDNVDAGASLGEILRLAGHTVTVASSGADGIRRARECSHDIALIDIGMPDLNGYAVAEILRQDPATMRTVLIALSGWGQPDDRARARAAGFARHLTKPVDLTLVENIISTLNAGVCEEQN